MAEGNGQHTNGNGHAGPQRLRFKNDTLNLYMEYVEETETPRLMHIWSLISSVGAIINRRAFLPFGSDRMYPNMYILLVGNPGVRKSTGVKILRRHLEKVTTVRFAPDDTADQRQGLLKAIIGGEEEGIEGMVDTTDIALIGQMEVGRDPVSQHTMYCMATEFESFMGANSAGMVPLLNKLYDADPYRYKLKTTEENLTDGLFAILGCTTPAILAKTFPKEAIGQGFMSRVVLVFGDKPYKKVFPPPPLNQALGAELDRRLAYITTNIEGEFTLQPDAERLLTELANKGIEIEDNRFLHYIQRRTTHLIKASLCLAAAEMRKSVSYENVAEAHAILSATEIGMPDALGEYGMSPVAMSKQRIVDVVRQAKQALAASVLWAVMHRDFAKISDFTLALSDLVQSGKLIKVQTHDGPAFIARLVQESKELQETLDEFTIEDPDDPEPRVAEGSQPAARLGRRQPAKVVALASVKRDSL